MNGFIAIDKGKDFTSFDVIAKLRGILKTKKIGHTGTLDPMATGVLVCMIGRAAKLIQYLPTADKDYRAEIRFGIATDTLDITGQIIDRCDKQITLRQIEDILPEFTGDILQLPPMFSAIKIDGQKLCDLARKGINLDRKSRKITIHKIDIIDFSNQVLSIDVSCSAGTYIRTLADDLGKELGTFATLKSLRRTAANGITIDKTITLDELEQAENPWEFVKNADDLLRIYPKVEITQPQAARVQNGGYLDLNRLNCEKCDDGALLRLFEADRFIALGKIDLNREIVNLACLFEV